MMTDEYTSSTNRVAFLRRIVEGGQEFRHRMGYPSRLVRVIESGRLVPVPLNPPVDTFWLRSVVCWNEWLQVSGGCEPYALDYRKPGYDQRLESHPVFLPEAGQLIREEIISDFTCDITDIKGISASRSLEYDISDIDDFPILRCLSYVEPVTDERLQENMSHGEIRLDRMRFAEYPWAKRRLYWLNSGGSNHFCSARYQAIRLNKAVPLYGELYRYSVNESMVQSLRKRWHMYLLPNIEVFGSFYDAMSAFKCPFGHSALPRNLHHYHKGTDRLRIIWLDREMPKTTAVAGVLSAAGFPDFGLQLDELCRGDFILPGVSFCSSHGYILPLE